MSEQSGTSGREEQAGEPKRWSMVPLIVGLFVMLALGIVGGYLLGTAGEASDSEGSEAVAPARPESGDSTQAARPVSVAPEGAALVPLTGPPESTMAMLETSTVSADATYGVTFRPYGYGPGQPGSSLVVRLEEATPRNASAERFDMTGRNVLATVVASDAEIAEGGVYTAILGFRLQGDLLSPMLRDVRRTD